MRAQEYTKYMRVVATIRLCLWCLVVAASLAVIVLNYAVSRVASDPAALQAIARDAETYDIIRHDILVPRILQEAQDAGYQELVTETEVTRAVDTAFDDANIDKLLGPATSSMANWLANKQPDAEFTIDASAQLSELTTLLADGITANILKQPDCTYANTLGDAAVGRCHVASLSEQEIHDGIMTALRSQQYIREGELSSDQLAIPDSVLAQTRNLPAHLNALNALAIFATGIVLLSTLWLIFKHRARGLIVLGSSALLAASSLYLLQFIALTHIHSFVLAPGYQEMVRALTRVTASELRSSLWSVVAAAAVLFAVGLVSLIVSRRRAARHKSSMHFDEKPKELEK